MKGHTARRRFGQNFLVDPHYIARIISAVDPKPGDRVVEIGPGLGALTGGLLSRAGRLDVIEIDRDLAARLAQQWPGPELRIHTADALEFDYAPLGDSLKVVGNLPYNISSPLIFHLATFESRLSELTVMLQKEVVDRMTAPPGTPEYGRLSVMLQYRFAVRRLFIVPPGAFRPVPQVDSAVVRLVPLGAGRSSPRDEALFARVVGLAFGQRRKTLRNALRTLCSAALIEAAGIDPEARGETLAVAQFVRLADLVAATA